MIVLDFRDKSIIHFLGHRGVSNTRQVATNLDMSWVTANNKLERLASLGYVIRMQDRKGKILWSLRQFEYKGRGGK